MSDATPGHFVWYELMTNDPAAAQDFYTQIVGWTAADAGMPGGDYTLLSKDGASIAGLMGMPPEAVASGARPGWRGYVSVSDTDAASTRFTGAGATLRFGPMDIPGVGRTASFTDPQGAPILLFTPEPGQARPHLAPGTPGTIGWNELHAADGPGAFDFYTGMFGWTAGDAVDMGAHGKYQTFEIGGTAAGAILTRFDPTQPPRWLYYINTDSIEAAIERVKKAGGQVVMGPQIVPGGSWIMHGVDTTGVAFAMVALQK
jgi:predicted enzyme related to lactoylglutathione lyase